MIERNVYGRGIPGLLHRLFGYPFSLTLPATVVERSKGAELEVSPVCAHDHKNIKAAEQGQEAIIATARALVAQLDAIKGAKGLVMIIDDSSRKINNLMQDGFDPYLHLHPEKGYVISQITTGDDAINMYRAFRELEGNTHHSVVMFMDGTLDQKDASRRWMGLEVAQIVVNLSVANGWPRPYFVGESNNDEPNGDLQDTYPDLYLGTKNPLLYLSEQLPLFAAIESKFQ